MITLFLVAKYMATLSNTDLKRGTVFRDDGDVYSVVSYSNQVRGRGSSLVRVKVRNLTSGGTQEKTYRDNEKVEAVDVWKSTLQYLYLDDAQAHFMDPDSFEQYEISREAVEPSLEYLKEGVKVIVLFIDEEPVSIELPKSVEMKVSQTVPAVKGDTANNPTKKAKLENGIEIDVPLFVKVGDSVKISTEDGSYLSRA